jgi:predicted ester cyclase
MIRDVVSEKAKDHDPADIQDAGAQAYIDFFTMMRSAFPDFGVEVEHLVAYENNFAFVECEFAGSKMGSYS